MSLADDPTPAAASLVGPARTHARRLVLALLAVALGASWGGAVFAQVRPTPVQRPGLIPAGTPGGTQVIRAGGATLTEVDDWMKRRDLCMAMVSRGIRDWQAQAALVDVEVDGPLAIGGRMSGPELSPLILAYRDPKLSLPIAKAFAGAVDQAWTDWTASIRVPGLPLYPSFAAYPGPQAAPLENVAVPMLALAQNPTSLTPPVLAADIRQRLGRTANEVGAQAAVEFFAQDFSARFGMWVSIMFIRKLMGSGPVPLYTLPFVPVSPVFRGRASMSPGALALPGFPVTD